MNTKAKMQYTLLVVCVILGLILTSCGVNHHSKVLVEESTAPSLSTSTEAISDSDGSRSAEMKEHSQQYVFPKSIKLQFKAVELVELAQEQIGNTWEHTKSVNFGEINEEPITLEVYKVDEKELCGSSYERVVLLEYKKVMYRYQYCFSNSLEGDDHPEKRSAMFLLDYKQLDTDLSRLVHGAVELSANGPGRMVYYLFDAAQGSWYAFEDWGYPTVVDLDGDGTAELVNQFPGLHLSWPDISIYRWNDNGLENNSSIKSALGIPNESMSEAILDNDNHRIHVVAVMSVDREHNEMMDYQYSNGEIIQIHGE